jgi:hypothetical protein
MFRNSYGKRFLNKIATRRGLKGNFRFVSAFLLSSNIKKNSFTFSFILNAKREEKNFYAEMNELEEANEIVLFVKATLKQNEKHNSSNSSFVLYVKS